MTLPEDSSQDKYKDIKRKLKAAIELNETLNKSFKKAKKKIRTLTFEKNLLLDSIVRMDHTSDELAIDSTTSTDSEAEVSSSLLSSIKQITQLSQRTHATITTTTTTTTRGIKRDASSLGTPMMKSTSTATVASAPPKRSKINKITVKTRRVQPIERDEFGNPKLPQQIGVLTVVSLGRIETERDTFHNERYIFPIGYSVKRTYPSMIDPHNNTIVTCTILDGGDGPRFHVVSADQPNQPIIANSATGAWSVIVRKSNEIRQREHSNSASGPDYYGFKHPTIAKMIQDLPGTRQLTNYVWQNFEEMEPRAAKGVMAAAEKKRDNLEIMGNANRKPRTIVVNTGGGGGGDYDDAILQHQQLLLQKQPLSPIKMDDDDDDDATESEVDELEASSS